MISLYCEMQVLSSSGKMRPRSANVVSGQIFRLAQNRRRIIKSGIVAREGEKAIRKILLQYPDNRGLPPDH